MKVALVHDDFVQAGGAENLFAEIASIFPEAPIYTSLVAWNKLPAAISRSRIRPSFMQKIPFATKAFKVLLPIYPLAFESFDFNDFDLVISSTTRFSKSIITSPKTIHICYANSVPRFLWSQRVKKEYLSPPLGFFTTPAISWLKRLDKAASSRVDFYIVNSKNVQGKIKKYYQRDSEVVYPFIDFNVYRPAKIHNWQLKNQNYYLIVSRLIRWKKIEIALETAKNLKINLKIVGSGSDKSKLKEVAAGNGNIEFLENLETKDLIDYYQNARALIVTQEEDFGLSALEAQACGIPVIAYGKGGVAEIVLDGKTGILFKDQEVKSLEDAIIKAKEVKWEIPAITNNARRFNKKSFTESLNKIISLYGKP